MSRASKPYRRFRARAPKEGEGSGDGQGLDALQALNRRGPAAPARGGREGRGVAGPERTPGAPRTPDRRDRRVMARAGRRWWSLRGLGPGGWAWRAALLLVVAVLAWAGFGLLALNDAVSASNDRVTPGARAALDDPPGGLLSTPTNILMIGSDSRKGETRSRADTILIMRVDPDAGRIKYLSIPRDYRVTLPAVGDQKINSAFYFGGQRGVVNAVKSLTGVPVNHLMVVKFNGFKRLVDELGGVMVTNPTAIVNCPYEAGRTVSFPKGEIDLDGERALEFSRVRKCDSDFERAARQQAVMRGIKAKVVSVPALWRAPWRGAAVVRTMNTDIGTFDMAKLGWLQARLEQRPGDRIVLSGEPQTIGGVNYVVQTDPDRNEREIARFMGGD